MRSSSVRLLALVGVVVGVSGTAQQYDNLQTSLSENRGRTSLERQERQSSYMGKIASIALKKLLKGAELVTSNAKRKTYRKQGDWKKAEQDFFDLNPREIRRPQRGYFRTQGQVVFGQKGNGRIRLIEKDTRTGKPLLEFTKTDTNSRPVVVKIFYQTPRN